MDYSIIAKSYDELYGEEQRNKLKIIKKHIPNESFLLDIGCGIGIAKEFFPNSIGIDHNFSLLNDVCCSGEYLPFKDKSFDSVICVTVLHHIKDLDKTLKEIRRVGKDYFAFSVMKKARNFSYIIEKVKEYFNVVEIEEEKDIILIEHVK